MPYVVIYIEDANDVAEVAYNDARGNTQYIGGVGDWSVGFEVMDVLQDWSGKPKAEETDK